MHEFYFFSLVRVFFDLFLAAFPCLSSSVRTRVAVGAFLCLFSSVRTRVAVGILGVTFRRECGNIIASKCRFLDFYRKQALKTWRSVPQIDCLSIECQGKDTKKREKSFVASLGAGAGFNTINVTHFAASRPTSRCAGNKCKKKAYANT